MIFIFVLKIVTCYFKEGPVEVMGLLTNKDSLHLSNMSLFTPPSVIILTFFPLSRYWLRLHCDRFPAEYLLHRHPGLGSLLPVPGRFWEKQNAGKKSLILN